MLDTKLNTERENIYDDEKEKIEDAIKDELELRVRINDLLEQYQFDMEAVLVNGMPEIKFIKT